MIKFTVPGIPQSKLRHRTFVTKSGHQKQYTPQETILYENMVAICCREAMNGTSQEKSIGPVRLAARFYFPIAETRRRKTGECDPHAQRPDLDNCIKSIKDGLNGVAWNDDCCVCEVVASKHWTHQQARAEIEVEEL
jgi:Holliday junction resolvase RusA-like endonuclease